MDLLNEARRAGYAARMSNLPSYAPNSLKPGSKADDEWKKGWAEADAERNELYAGYAGC